MDKLTHIDQQGKASMVDVGDKSHQIRVARAKGFIKLGAQTIELIKENKMKKGDVLTIAEIAGIQGAKKCSELIPLCHPLQLTKVEVKTTLTDTGVEVNSMAKCIGQTGVEMEALTAVNVALLTVYDMCKAVDKEMIMTDVTLIEKTKTDLEK
ncbi:MAG: cyclic pyranopterin monophosphate synthase MoaC [Bacteroidetes bacterium]|nr:cyclic pyranopterin monophosphate synthase MoaC [Bacteroidota bacterium]|tara:strand:- start:458 stop:916 length:459 start_codon:yes stop_codon:yes gene_type:complete